MRNEDELLLRASSPETLSILPNLSRRSNADFEIVKAH
jgi:hypothetical protein